VFGAMLS